MSIIILLIIFIITVIIITIIIAFVICSYLRLSAVICGYLQLSAVICGYLRAPNLLREGAGEPWEPLGGVFGPCLSLRGPPRDDFWCPGWLLEPQNHRFYYGNKQIFEKAVLASRRWSWERIGGHFGSFLMLRGTSGGVFGLLCFFFCGSWGLRSSFQHLSGSLMGFSLASLRSFWLPDVALRAFLSLRYRFWLRC